jgi:hypothetical protein
MADWDELSAMLAEAEDEKVQPTLDELAPLLAEALAKWIERGYVSNKARILSVMLPREEADDWADVLVADVKNDRCTLAPTTAREFINDAHDEDYTSNWRQNGIEFEPTEIVAARRFCLSNGLISAVDALGNIGEESAA